MIVLALLGVMTMVAVPGFQGLLQRTQLRTEASRLLLALNLARSEAIIRNTPVSLCPSSFSSGGELVCEGDYSAGWLVFSNRNRDGSVDPDDVLLRAFGALPARLTLTNRAGLAAVEDVITWLPDGSSRRNRSLMFCIVGRPELSSWSVVLNLVGRPRLARDWGTCPGPG
jgi:Tfp pilus assembly protein FimT